MFYCIGYFNNAKSQTQKVAILFESVNKNEIHMADFAIPNEWLYNSAWKWSLHKYISFYLIWQYDYSPILHSFIPVTHRSFTPNSTLLCVPLLFVPYSLFPYSSFLYSPFLDSDLRQIALKGDFRDILLQLKIYS